MVTGHFADNQITDKTIRRQVNLHITVNRLGLRLQFIGQA